LPHSGQRQSLLLKIENNQNRNKNDDAKVLFGEFYALFCGIFERTDGTGAVRGHKTNDGQQRSSN
jgi:hypothetical protein